MTKFCSSANQWVKSKKVVAKQLSSLFLFGGNLSGLPTDFYVRIYTTSITMIDELQKHCKTKNHFLNLFVVVTQFQKLTIAIESLVQNCGDEALPLP